MKGKGGTNHWMWVDSNNDCDLTQDSSSSEVSPDDPVQQPPWFYAEESDGAPPAFYLWHALTRVELEPNGDLAQETKQLYLVRAAAADYFHNYSSPLLLVLPPEWLQIKGQALANSGQTNAMIWIPNRAYVTTNAVWGETVLSAPAGMPVEVTPTFTQHYFNNDFLFVMQANEINLQLAVDANRDGDITFDGQDQTTADKPYRFWVNDDQDYVYTLSGDNAVSGVDETVPVTVPDYANDQIKTIRDLEDFARLNILVQGITNEIANGTFQIGLKWKNVTGSPVIKLWKNKSPNGDTEYLTDASVAQQFLTLRDPGYVAGPGAYLISSNFWQDIGINTTNSMAYLLFEGCAGGKGQLVVTMNKADGTELAEAGGVWLDLDEVTNMYERVVITNDMSGAKSNWTSTIGVVQPATSSALGDDTDLIVLVHGINVDDDHYLSASATVFKRLYWSGYHGKFFAVKWPCNLLTPIPDPLSPAVFNDSELQGYKASQALAAYLPQLRARFPGYRLHLLVHSQGNAVVSEAIKSGATFDTYILTQGALPDSAYDVNAPIDYDIAVYEDSRITPEWQPTGYRGIYTNFTGNIVNFYNPLDPVLDWWVKDQKLLKPSIYFDTSYYFTAIP